MKKFRLAKDIAGWPKGTVLLNNTGFGKLETPSHTRTPAVQIFVFYSDIENALKDGWIEEVPERISLYIHQNINVRKSDNSNFNIDELSKMEAALNGELFTKDDVIDVITFYVGSDFYGVEEIFLAWFENRKK